MTDSKDLKGIALALLRAEPNDGIFVNRILDSVAHIDEGAKIYWNNIHPDKNVRKKFRELLQSLNLLEVEKKVTSSGAKIGLAFVKPPDCEETNLFGRLRNTFTAAFEKLCEEQVKTLVEEQADRRAATEREDAPGVVDDNTVDFDSADQQEDTQDLQDIDLVGGGLLSLDEYRKRKAAGKPPELMHFTMPAPKEALNILEHQRRSRGNASSSEALRKYARTRKLQEDLWGLSSARQSKLRKQLEDKS